MRLTLHRAQCLPRSRAERGMGLVELMVGITVGLIVTAGAAVVATRQITEHRRLMLEVQMQQDLRTAADLLQQEMRRAGYRGLPANGVWEPEHIESSGPVSAKAASASPYTVLSQSAGMNDLLYRYAKPEPANETNVLAASEQFGILLKNQALYLQLGAVEQPITDRDAVLIDSFLPVITTQQISLADVCNCPAGSACPTLTVRYVTFTIGATAKADSNVKRTLTVTEKIRADAIDGVCQ